MDAVNPSLVKDLRKGHYLNLLSSSYFLMQENMNPTPNRPLFRIITTGFPRYKIAGSNDLLELRETWSFIHASIPNTDQKMSSRKLVRLLRVTARVHMDSKCLGGFTDEEHEDGDGDEEHGEREDTHDQDSSDCEVFEGLGIDIESAKEYDMTSKEGLYTVSKEEEEEEGNASNSREVYIGDKNHSSSEELMEHFIEQEQEQTREQEGSGSNLNADLLQRLTGFGLDDFIVTYLAALLPPPLPLPGKKESLYYIKESHLVKKRQRLLLLLSALLLLLRFCSFDFFIFSFLVLNFSLLYALRNSKKINVAMAKRSVKSRVGWAKQYLGGLIHRNQTTTVQQTPTPSTNGNTSQPEKSGRMRLLSKLKRKPKIEIVTDGEAVRGVSGEESFVEDGKKGLFRRSVKSDTTNANSHGNRNSGVFGSNGAISPVKSAGSPVNPSHSFHS